MMTRNLSISSVMRTHDKAGLKLDEPRQHMRFQVDDGEPFDLPIHWVPDLIRVIEHWRARGQGEPFIITEMAGLGDVVTKP